MTIRDIARLAQVSVATVSRYLDVDKRHLVRPETQELIASIIRENDYVPNKVAQHLSKRCSSVIGMVTPFGGDVAKSAYFSHLMAGVIDQIKDSSYSLEWIMLRNEEIKEQRCWDIIKQHNLAGTIFLSWRHMPQVVEEVSKKSKAPVVLVNEYCENIQASIIHCDNWEGVNLVGEYILKKGYRNIGVVRGPDYVSYDAKYRYQFFKEFFHQRDIGLLKKYECVCDAFHEVTAYRNIKEQFANIEDLPEVFFCMNDHLAEGVIQALHDLGVSVPNEVAVIGFDDMPPRTMDYQIPLTTVRQPLEKIGREAVVLLGEVIKDPEITIHKSIKPELVIRESA